jgi:UDP-GlcNAc:undecaprenyl-phosphate/decaprenyl-phosphate GlcNAc-1-phosphate transferase
VTSEQAIAFGVAFVAAAVVTSVLIRARARRPPPPQLIRINISGREVPAVLGGPIVAGALCGLAVATVARVAAGRAGSARAAAATALVLAGLYLAGSWDDMRGDERPRGFAGHLEAARSLRLTGGIVKLAAGAATGLISGVILVHGLAILEVGLMVALAANLINLLDRAPGRAGKVALTMMISLIAFGAAGWSVAAAGVVGAIVVSLPSDLAERAMLGDSGANPIGGVVGLGFAISLPGGWRVAVILVLLALNLASERWSFSRAIARTPVLRAFDRIGRRQTL